MLIQKLFHGLCENSLCRNGIELPFIAKDDSYDFAYQRQRIINPERTVKKGDDLLAWCEITTRGHDRPITVCLESLMLPYKMNMKVALTHKQLFVNLFLMYLPSCLGLETAKVLMVVETTCHLPITTKGAFRQDAKQRKATRSNQNLTSSTARERLQPVATFASSCTTSLASRL